VNLLYANDIPGTYPPSWYADTAVPRPIATALDRDIQTQVAVVGAGYTGLSAALHLAQAGRQVVLVDAHRVGWGASGRNGGQIGSGQRIDQPELEESLGHDMARDLWAIGQDARELVKSLIARHAIPCDLTPGITYTDHRQRYAAGTRAYVEHMNRHYDTALQYLDAGAVRERLGTQAYYSGLHDPDGAHLHPLNYALGLATAARTAGVTIHENTPVTSRDGRVLQTPGGQITADHVVLACNGYLGGLDDQVSRHVMPINNYIVATEPLGEALARELIPHNEAVADSKFVVNYFRLSRDNRMLFGGGESYSYRFPRDLAAKARKPMIEIFPQLADAKITHAWGGTLAITLSRLPYLRRLQDGVMSASGYSGHGVALATLSGALMAEAITGDSPRFDTMARLAHRAFPGPRRWRTPLLALAMSWYALRDRL